MQRIINEKIVTFAISIIGVKIGNEFGDRYERRAEIVGGFILIFMGVKILLEHLENIDLCILL